MNGGRASSGHASSNYADGALVEELVGYGKKCKPSNRREGQMDALQAQLLRENSAREMLVIEEALASLERFTERPSAENFMCILQKCKKKKSLAFAKRVHTHIRNHGLEAQRVLGNYLVSTFVECQSMSDAQEVFDRLPHRNESSWISLIQGYIECGESQHALNLLQKMQGDCVYVSKYTFVKLLKACSRLKSVEAGQEVHAKIVEHKFENHFFVGNTLVGMYAKCGSLAEACDVFDRLQIRDVVSWSALIAGYAERGLGGYALKCLEQMQLEGVSPNAVTFVSSLKACGSTGAIDMGREIHTKILKQGYQNDPFVGNALVDMYAKCDSIAEAQEVFDGLPVQDVVSWTALLGGYAELGFDEEALNCLEQMQQEGVTPNAVTFVCGLKSCGSIGAIDRGRKIHIEIMKLGFERDHSFGSILVDMYSKCNSLVEAQKVFDNMPDHNIILWTALIAGYVEHGLGDEALNCLEGMQLEGMSPDAVMLVCCLKACGSIGDIDRGREIHAEIAKQGFERYPFAGSTLVDMYGKCGSLAEAQEVLNKLPVRDIVSWNALIAGYAEHGLGEEVMNAVEQMQVEDVTAHAVTFVCSLKACGSMAATGSVQEIHTQIAKEGFDRNPFVGSTLVDMYAECGLLVEAQEIFDKLPVQDVVSWNILVARYSEHGLGVQALNVLKQMQLDGVHVNAVTLICCLKVCGRVGAIDWGREIHTEIAKLGSERESFVGNALVDMYAKCGSIVEAHEVFNTLSVRDVILWNALIAGYAEHRLGEEALMCLQQMQLEGVCPNAVTFVCSLKACGVMRAVDRGWEIQAEIIRHGYERYPFVGSNLVDMHVKCGSLAEAREVFDTLPCQDVVLWTTLIAGYAEHGLGEEALNCFECMQLEGVPLDAVTFVCSLKACGGIGAVDRGRGLHAQIAELGFERDGFVGNTLVDMYAKCGLIAEAQEVFDKLPVQDSVLWNTLMTGYARQGESETVFYLFERMREEGIRPDGITFLSVLTVCSHAGLVDEGWKYFEAMSKKFGVTKTTEHHNCMVDLFCRAGQLNEAVAVMEKMPFQFDVVTLSIVLGACERWGNVELGKQAFECVISLDEKYAAAFILMSNIYVDASMWEDTKKIEAMQVNI